MIAVGRCDCLVTLENPGDAVPDGGGGYFETWAALVPGTMWAHIDAASQADMERLAPGTVLGMATHVIQMGYHPGVTIKTRVQYDDPDRGPRIFQVMSVQNPDEARRDLVLVASELL